MATTQKKTWQDVLNSVAGKENVAKGGSGEAKIGEYQEAPGGGTPLPKGVKAPSKAWVAANRTMQPRDSQGQFTYNSANRKELKYGPSRGTTVPPFLIGFKITFAKSSGKGALVDLDGKKYTLPDKYKTKEDFIKACQQYKEGNQDFEGFGNLGDIAKGKGGKTGQTFTIERGKFMQTAHAAKAKTSNMGTNKFAKEKAQNQSTQPVAEENKTAQSQQSKTVDYSLAKSDPKKFISDNFDEIQGIVDIAAKNGYEDIDVDQMVSDIGEGKINFDQIKKAISEG